MVKKTHIPQQEEGQIERSVQMRAADPSTPALDQVWINKTDQKMRYGISGGSGIAEIGTALVSGSSLPDEGFANFISTKAYQALGTLPGVFYVWNSSCWRSLRGYFFNKKRSKNNHLLANKKII